MARRSTCTTFGRPPQEIQEVIDAAIASEMFTREYADVFAATSTGGRCHSAGDTFAWERRPRTCASRRTSTACRTNPLPSTDVDGARVLAVLGDSVTTDHISPAGSIKADSPAGQYLIEQGVSRATSTRTDRVAATTR